MSASSREASSGKTRVIRAVGGKPDGWEPAEKRASKRGVLGAVMLLWNGEGSGLNN